MIPIADFLEEEIRVVQEATHRRYGAPVEIEAVTSELRLYPEDRELTNCPGLYWEGRGASFLLSKIGDNHFRCLFFYRARTQYGTGVPEYSDIKTCITHLLQVQADHEAKGGE
ncbi:conserved hypothetical protein [Gammaproteobacteria bacterium]